MTKTDDELLDRAFGLSAPPPAEAAAGNRLKRIGPQYRAPEVLKELKDRHRHMIALMVHGTDDAARAAQFGLKQFEPFGWKVAADAARVRRKEARRLLSDKLFRNALATELRALGDSAKPHALHTIIRTLDREGEGKAADAKVRLEAAKIVLADDAPAVAVKAGVAQGLYDGLRPGVVIKLKTNAPAAPIETQEATEAQAERADAPRLPLRTKLG